MSGIDPNQFWSYSLSLYGAPRVEAACLELQDKHGLNVNILLLACWAGEMGIELSRPVLETVIAKTTRWSEEVIAPLRSVRQILKGIENGDADRIELRSGIKHHELAAERIQQKMLVTALDGLAIGNPSVAFARNSLNAYTSITGCGPSSNHLTGTILAAAFES